MIINQVGSGNKPDALDNQLLYVRDPFVVVFERHTESEAYDGAITGECIDTYPYTLKGDRHIYQSFKKTGIFNSNVRYGPSETVSLSTHDASGYTTAGTANCLPFNKTSFGEKKGSGLMFVYFQRKLHIYTPSSESYGIFTKFTFDFTDGKDIITPEITSVGPNDVGSIHSSGDNPAVVGYIINVTFE